VFVSPVALLRRLPGPVQLLVLGTLVNRVGSFIVPFLAIVLRREFGMSPSEVGLFRTADRPERLRGRAEAPA
jgi:hypothetical protein